MHGTVLTPGAGLGAYRYGVERKPFTRTAFPGFQSGDLLFSAKTPPQAAAAKKPGFWRRLMLWVGLPMALLGAGFQLGSWVEKSRSSGSLPVVLATQEGYDVSEAEKMTYPAIEPFRTRMLPVSPLHQLYVEESGNPDGVPVLYLHGGPGAGIDGEYRKFFDPTFFHIIGFEQRGAGRSTPAGEIRENTTWDMVEDIEKIRDALGVKGKALIFGGSWGSLLGLAYAETHPEHVSGLILRGISLGRPQDTGWAVRPGEGIFNYFPEAGEMFRRGIAGVPLSEEDIRLGRDPYLGAYYRLFTDPSVSETRRLEAVRDWNLSDDMLSGEKPVEKPLEAYREDLESARMVCHFYYYNAFMSPADQLLRDVHKLKDIPQITIVNGRRDRKTPPIRAYALHQALKNAGIESKLHIVDGTGHSAWEPPNTRILMDALKEFQARESLKPGGKAPPENFS